MNAHIAIADQSGNVLAREAHRLLPPKLSKLLDESAAFNDLPVIGPISAQKLRDYVLACQATAATPLQINRMIAHVANMMPCPRGMTDEEAAERMTMMRHALRSLAATDLKAVFDAILRTCRFFPTVAEIEQISAPIRARRMARANRAEMLVMKHDREWQQPLRDTGDGND